MMSPTWEGPLTARTLTRLIFQSEQCRWAAWRCHSGCVQFCLYQNRTSQTQFLNGSCSDVASYLAAFLQVLVVEQRVIGSEHDPIEQCAIQWLSHGVAHGPNLQHVKNTIKWQKSGQMMKKTWLNDENQSRLNDKNNTIKWWKKTTIRWWKKQLNDKITWLNDEKTQLNDEKHMIKWWK